MAAQLEITYPETLPDAISKTREEFERETKMASFLRWASYHPDGRRNCRHPQSALPASVK